MVGVGFPNPLGKETSPPQWIPRRQLCRIYPQRGGHVGIREARKLEREQAKLYA